MNINDVLNEKLTQHLTKGNAPPSAVYLGYREESALIHEMDKMLNVKQQVAGYPPRAKWNGLSVYRVNDEHHIAFA